MERENGGLPEMGLVGWSKDEVLATFRIQPWIMTLSEEKINVVMSFCVEEMGWKPLEVVRIYYLLTLSLNKRIRPRWSVYQELVSKRFVKKEGKVKIMFLMSEELFLEKYVECCEDEAPFLSKLYLEKMEASKEDEETIMASPNEAASMNAKNTVKTASVEGMKSAAIACVVSTIVTLGAVRTIPAARKALNHTGQALVISSASIAAYFITADKTILKAQQKNAQERYIR